jgi:anti-sigma28 factor (negative regulator of flagellin synthesis)
MRLQLDPAITGSGIGRTGETGQTQPTGAGGGPNSASGRAIGADSVSISGASSALNQSTAERSARIEQLTALVQGGSYDVSSTVVGHAVVGNALSGGA